MKVDEREVYELLQERAAIAEALMNSDVFVVIEGCSWVYCQVCMN